MHSPANITTLGVTAGTQVFAGRCVLTLAIITAGGAAAATLSIHDGTSASDQRILFLKAPIDISEGIAGSRIWCHKGMFVVTTGAASETQIGFE